MRHFALGWTPLNMVQLVLDVREITSLEKLEKTLVLLHHFHFSIKYYFYIFNTLNQSQESHTQQIRCHEAVCDTSAVSCHMWNDDTSAVSCHMWNDVSCKDKEQREQQKQLTKPERHDSMKCRMWTTATECWPVFQLPRWHRSSESCTQRTHCSGSQAAWLQLFKSCTGCQSLRGSSTSCACWFRSHFWDTRRNISQTVWHRLPIFQVDLHCVLHHVATSSCRKHDDELATEHGTGCRQSWNCCCQRTCFVMIWKHFCFILSTSTRIQIDSVMRPRSSSRGRNTSASVTVTVTITVTNLCKGRWD